MAASMPSSTLRFALLLLALAACTAALCDASPDPSPLDTHGDGHAPWDDPCGDLAAEIDQLLRRAAELSAPLGTAQGAEDVDDAPEGGVRSVRRAAASASDRKLVMRVRRPRDVVLKAARVDMTPSVDGGDATAALAPVAESKRVDLEADQQAMDNVALVVGALMQDPAMDATSLSLLRNVQDAAQLPPDAAADARVPPLCAERDAGGGEGLARFLAVAAQLSLRELRACLLHEARAEATGGPEAARVADVQAEWSRWEGVVAAKGGGEAGRAAAARLFPVYHALCGDAVAVVQHVSPLRAAASRPWERRSGDALALARLAVDLAEHPARLHVCDAHANNFGVARGGDDELAVAKVIDLDAVYPDEELRRMLGGRECSADWHCRVVTSCSVPCNLQTRTCDATQLSPYANLRAMCVALFGAATTQSEGDDAAPSAHFFPDSARVHMLGHPRDGGVDGEAMDALLAQCAHPSFAPQPHEAQQWLRALQRAVGGQQPGSGGPARPPTAEAGGAGDGTRSSGFRVSGAAEL